MRPAPQCSRGGVATEQQCSRQHGRRCGKEKCHRPYLARFRNSTLASRKALASAAMATAPSGPGAQGKSPAASRTAGGISLLSTSCVADGDCFLRRAACAIELPVMPGWWAGFDRHGCRAVSRRPLWTADGLQAPGLLRTQDAGLEKGGWVPPTPREQHRQD